LDVENRKQFIPGKATPQHGSELRTIGDVAIITAGHHYRKRVLDDPGGKYRVFHTGDLDLNAEVLFGSLKRTSAGKIRRDRLGEVTLRPGDVALQSRGKFRAFYFEDPPRNIIVPSHYYILRCAKDKCLGEYIALKLNSSLAGAIKMRAEGRTPFVSKDSILALAISLPPLAAQSHAIMLSREFRADWRNALQKIPYLFSTLLQSLG